MKLILFALMAFLVVGSTTAATTTNWQPAQHTTWQIQIQGAIDTSVNAQMYDIDLFDARPGEINAGIIAKLHGQGRKVFCYMDSGAWESYRPDASLFPASVIGNTTGWAGEKWMDIRKSAWPLFEPLIVKRMQLAVSLGCDGVDPDQNNPVGNNPGFPITYADEYAWYLEVAADAHALGLAVLQKNGVELLGEEVNDTAGLVAAFDGMVNESCNQYGECGYLTAYTNAGKPVFEIEYKGTTSRFCPKLQALGLMTLKKKLSLYAYQEPCW
jgi:hypothetical protein